MPKIADAIQHIQQRGQGLAEHGNIRVCPVGAMVESEQVTLAAECGFSGGRVRQRFNCFYDTTAKAKVAKDLFIQPVNFFARKGEGA